MKKFFGVIGNPPYQQDMQGTSDNPIYHHFMDESYLVGERVELITPARFLFNAGKTPKNWNRQMLSDEHLKVLHYEPDSAKVFAGNDIKGGVVVTLHDDARTFGAIDTFTRFNELNAIIKKVKSRMTGSISDIVYSPESYKMTKLMHQEHPEIEEQEMLSKGHAYDVTSNIFEKLGGVVFFDAKPNDGNDYIQVFGRKNNARIFMWIDIRYIGQHPNLNKYKLFFPKSNGSGQFGEVMSRAEVGKPLMGHTQTFLSMGAFDTEDEANALMKYVSCKFTRTMLGVLKVTQDNKKASWALVPLQDFTSQSDIDWSKPIPEIDQQLYAKYGLDDDEIEFIETHVKEMS